MYAWFFLFQMQSMLRLTHLVSTWIMLQVEKAKRRYYSNEVIV